MKNVNKSLNQFKLLSFNSKFELRVGINIKNGFDSIFSVLEK